jgi:LPXTG-site transpeptidase (sortase) family protein
MTEAAESSRPMRLVIGVDTFPPDINGASRFAERLAAGLVRAGHEVHVIAPSYNKRYGTFTEVHDSSSMTVHRLKSYRVVQHKTLRYVWPFTLKAKTDRILKDLKPEAVHINSHMIIGRYLLKSARQQGIRVVATNHIMPENLIKYSLVIPRWAEKMVMNLAWKDAGRVLSQADVVTTPTRKAANLLESAAGLKGVLAVSCGIDATKFANNSPTSSKAPSILFLGRLDYEKHIHNLIKAVALLPKSLKVKLEIVGDGGEREFLEGLSKDLGIEKSVTFWGHISDEELPGFYERATVFAMPSIAELQSIATMEAMASGRPIVAADAMALPHLVHDGDNGYLFPPGDVKAFAHQLERVLSADKEELKRLSENSLHLIQSHDIKKTIEIFEKIYLGHGGDQNETSDNLVSYSLPIGRLSRSVSRAISATRKQSAKLRESVKLAGEGILSRAEAAKDEVRVRLEDVSDGFAFAATRFSIRVRKGIKRASDKLRVEEGFSKPDITPRNIGGIYTSSHLWNVLKMKWTLLVSKDPKQNGNFGSLGTSGEPVETITGEGGQRQKSQEPEEPKLEESPAGQPSKGISTRLLGSLRDFPKTSAVQDSLLTSGVVLLLFLFWYLVVNDPVQAERQEQSAVSVVEEWMSESNIEGWEAKAAAGPSDELPPIVGIPALGDAFAALYVPRFGEDYVRVIAEGTGTESLNSFIRGVGRYTESDSLGDFGNFAIAAHRNAFGAPFSKIDQLRIGDKIYVEVPDGWFEYEYRNTEYVFESEISVLDSFPRLGAENSDSRLITLTSCHPRFSTAERVIAYGVFQGWYPRSDGAPVELFEILERRG